MHIDYQKLRLDGIYQQDKDGHLMLRIKNPAGVLSSTQAEAIGNISKKYSNAVLHLTCRGSIEFHWLRDEHLAAIFRQLAAVGLSSRGACGGAVHGISCSTTFEPDFALVQSVAHRLNRHFMGNPCFEGLPKKFKIGIETGYRRARHLIQDVGLVYTGSRDDQPCFNVWCAGGLGRLPQAAFLLENCVPESELIPLIEAVALVYRDHTPPPKRLKYLPNQLGEAEFRDLLHKQRLNRQGAVRQETLAAPTITTTGTVIQVPVFAGELPAADLLELAAIAREAADGFLAVTADQNTALYLSSGLDEPELHEQLTAQGFCRDPDSSITFRICPGSHECRMGLGPTRGIARQIIAAMGESGRKKTWAISGCSNCCSQPQLADFGIIIRKPLAGGQDVHKLRFDLLQRNAPDRLGEPVQENIGLAEVQNVISGLN